MAVLAFLTRVSARVVHVISISILLSLALSSLPANAQWTSLSAPGQATRSVAKEPTVMAIAKSARKLAIGHSYDKSVAFYHADTAALLGTTILPKEPVAIVLSDDGSKAFALYESSGIKIAVISAATFAISSTWSTTGNPVGMVLSGTELLVADSNANRLVGINSATGAITRTKTLSKEPQMISIGATPALILVGVKNGELQLLDSNTLTVSRTVQVGDEIRSLAWWDGSGSITGRVLAIGKNQNALNLVDPATGEIARVALGGDPNTVGVEQYNNWAYVGEKDDLIISVIDLIDRALSGHFTIPGKIGSILFDQQGGLLFVTMPQDDKLLKLDPNQASLISKIGVSKTLKDVALNDATAEAVAISDKDTDFARVNLQTMAVQTLALPVKSDRVVIDSGLNVAVVGTTNNKVSFVNLGTSPASLYASQVDLDGNIQDMAVDPTRNITIAVVSGQQNVRVIDNVARSQIVAVPTSEKFIAVAIHSGKGLAYLVTESKKLALFNLATRTITQTISLSFDAGGIAVDPVLNRAVLTTPDQDKAWILNLDTLQMVTGLTMAKSPRAVAIQTDTHTAVVASKDDDSLSLIDLNTNFATLNFNRIGKPTGLTVSNRFNKVLVVSSDKVDLAVIQLPNPPAGLNSIAPTQVVAGANATTLTLSGTHFIDGSIVYFGATALATTWVSSNSLTAIIPASLLDAAGTNNIRVQNPVPAGGNSISLAFTVTATVPVLDSVNPVSTSADNTAKTFTLTGSNFSSPLTVIAGTQSFAVTSSTATSAQITLPAAMFNLAGPINVAVMTAAGTSGTKTITVTAIAPAAPSISSVTAGNGSATVSFNAPSSNGGSVITSYSATSSPGNVVGSCPAPCTSIAVSGLTNGTAYTFTVRATNDAGTGLASPVSSSVTPVGTAPDAPSIGIAVAGNALATVSFTAPTNNGGSAITAYTVTASPGALSATGSGSPVVVSGLTNGAAYTFSVRATNSYGISAASSASNSVIPATVPGAPIIGLATAGNAQVSISFSPPASNGGSAITTYTATCGGQSATAAASPITVSSLPNGVAVTCSVSARNSVGIGAQSAASNSVTPSTVPTAPTIGIATAGDARVTISFSAPASTGGTSITGYLATCGTQSAAGTSSPIIVIGLPNDVAVSCTVVALNVNGSGPSSVASNTVTPHGVTPPLPPDPATIAPSLDRTVASNIATTTAFLYTGNSPIQTGVAPGTISPIRVAVIRGRVLGLDGQPIPAVTISVLNHPEFGQTITRIDGRFDMAINGGGQITIDYKRAGYLPVQRSVRTPWQDFVIAPDIVLTQLDSQVTNINLNNNTMQSARGSAVTDADGTRRATVFFPGGTSASMTLADGSTVPLTSMSVRATEYTVGTSGFQAMPSSLPPTSGYTYAVELSVDEAIAAGAKTVTFSQPVPVYVENFLNFPVGGIVPSGYYDRDRAAWVPSPNGRVIKILAISNGLAELDTDGDGLADNAAKLAALSISDTERQKLAELYQPGLSLWRVPVSHFTPWDFNWPFGPPLDATPPDQPDPTDDNDKDICDEECGSIIDTQNQTLGERVTLIGAPFSLNYKSDRVPGRKGANTIYIPLSGNSVPPSLLRIELVITVAGREFKQTFPPTANQFHVFTWDGTDSYGRTVQGSQSVTVDIGYGYGAFYFQPGTYSLAFGQTGNGIRINGDRARRDIIIWQKSLATVGAPQDARANLGLGGWTASVHHTYDPKKKALVMGDGARRSAQSINRIITTVVGGGTPGFSGDGGFATASVLNGPTNVAVDAQGNVYIADTINQRVRKINSAGIITTVAGNGAAGFSGDGGAATSAAFNGPRGLSVDTQGNLFIADTQNHRIRKVTAAGIVTTVAGNGTAGFSGDGSSATAARLSQPYGVLVDSLGNLFIADFGNHRIRKVDTAGVITAVAGSGSFFGGLGDGGAATFARLSGPQGVGIDLQGNLFIADSGNNRVRKVDAAGIITTVAGNGSFAFGGDGGPATLAALRMPVNVAIDMQGNLFILDSLNRRVRKVNAAGTITTVAGTGAGGFSGDGGPATLASLFNAEGFSIDTQGNLFIADTGNGRIRMVGGTGIISTIAGGNGTFTFSGDGGAAAVSVLNGPTGVTVDPSGNLFLSDSQNHRIRKVNPAGIITTVAGNGTQGIGGDGGLATAAQLSSPDGLATDAQGNLFIADLGNNRVRKIDGAGIITTIAGNGTGFSGDGGFATAATFNGLRSIGLDAQGNLFIADSENSRIRKIDSAGIITTVVGNGSFGFSGDAGAATAASLNRPLSVTVDAQGNLYFVDSQNLRVRKVDTAGIITTVAGNGSSGFSGDGSAATSAGLGFPRAISLDAQANLFIADSGNLRIRKVDKAGIITTVAGNGSNGLNGDGGPATAATLRAPASVAIDPNGTLYFVDVGNGRIRKVAASLPGFDGTDLLIPSADGNQLYNFDSVGRHLRTLSAKTSAVLYSFSYDPNGLLIQVTDGDGDTTRIERDAAGNPTAIVSADGQRTTLALDGNGWLAAITNPANEAHRMSYSADGLLMSFAPPKGNTSTMVYDSVGRLVRDQNAANGFWGLARTDGALGHTVTLTSAEGRSKSSQVEDFPNGDERRTNTSPDGTKNIAVTGTNGVTTSTAANGTIVTTSQGPDPRFGMQAPLDANINVRLPSGLTSTATTTRTVSLSDPNNLLSLIQETTTANINGRTFSARYDAMLRQTTGVSAEGRITTTRTDPQGRPTFAQIAGVEAVSYNYDVRGRITGITQGTGADSRSLTIGYGGDGMVQTITDALTQQLAYQRDAAGRITQATLPGSRVVGFGFDANSNITSITPPGRTAHSFGLNAVDLEDTYTPPAAGLPVSKTEYRYNLDKQLTNVIRPDGATITVGYDSGGRLGTITPTPGAGNIVTYGYNPSTGQLNTLTNTSVTLGYIYDGALPKQESFTGAVTGNLTRSYDTNFRVTSLALNGSNITLGYDRDSLLTSAGVMSFTRNPTNGFLTGTTLGAVTTSQSYNPFGELASFATNVSGAPLYTYAFTYDKLGRIQTKTETLAGMTTNHDYGYDAAGRLETVKQGGVLLRQYGFDANSNRTRVNGSLVGTYDDQDRIQTYAGNSYSFGANGELKLKASGGQTTQFSYDVFGNLNSVTLPNGTLIEYVADGRNRRVGKKVNGVLTQGFLYQSQLRIAAELDAMGNVVSRFVYGNNINVPEYMVKGGTNYRIVTDHLGSVRLVVNAATGGIAQRMDFDEFGNVQQDTNPGFQPFGFAGGLYDRDTKLVRFGARDYEAETGRWVAKDPIGFDGGDTNLYGYVGNDPVNFIDPRGKNPVAAVRVGWGVGQRIGEAANPYVQPLISRAIDSLTGYDDIIQSTSSEGKSSDKCPGTNNQFGKKFGEHKDPEKPGYRDDKEYRKLADDIYNDPNAKRTKTPSGETQIQRGNDLLRLDPNGNFRSLYPIR